VHATADYTKRFGWGFRVSFIARAPVTNARSEYAVALTLPGCGRAGLSYERNVALDEHLSVQGGFLPRTPGRYNGAVYFVTSTAGGPLLGGPLGASGTRGSGVLIGSFTLVVPPHRERGAYPGCS
jgi:hypothetical protein